MTRLATWVLVVAVAVFVTGVVVCPQPVGAADPEVVSNVLTTSLKLCDGEGNGDGDGEPEPALVVVSTLAAELVTATGSTLRGLLDSDGGEARSVRFQYGTTMSYGLDTVWIENKVSGDAFSASVTNLLPGTVYHFRALARNGSKTVEGSDRTFSTLSVVHGPLGLTAVPGVEQVVLSWVRGEGASGTVIRRSADSYPTSPTSGDQVYVGADTSCVDAGLVGGATYYYSAWSVLGSVYSAEYVTVAVTPAVPLVPSDGTSRSWLPILLGVFGLGAVAVLVYFFKHRRATEDLPPLPEGAEPKASVSEAEEKPAEEPKEPKEPKAKGKGRKKAEDKKTPEEVVEPQCPKCNSKVVSEKSPEGTHTCMSCGEVFDAEGTNS